MEKQVKCPQCKTLTVYSEKNPFRPFCSERCRLLDFGDWAAGKFSIPVEDTSNPTKNSDDDSAQSMKEEDDGEF